MSLFLQRVAGFTWKDEALICRLFVREVDNVVVNNQQTLPKGFGKKRFSLC
ncbi:conserved hypothetical protein [Vibrio chagasii]|nr:conserved hypothetical protein [Vibrio chagasii]CAH7100063.1 conserved hypothetical protein [Vibrio chagasii]CAH7177340.1 conserved hypothetical protein [Vibrio chagasii]